MKNRLIGRTFVEGDTTLVMMLGHSVQFTVVMTQPHGIVKMTLDTKLQTFTEPVAEAKGVPRITYEDIGGLKEEAQRTREIVELPMRHPEIFQRLGIDPPKGVLLLGPRARIYTQLVTFENDDYVCKAATSVKEASELIEAGFEYVCDVTDVQLFRKRK